MKKVYLVRHGQTAWTTVGRVQGWAPVPLNDTGQNQMQLTGEYLSDQLPVSEDVQIITSDVRRAEESAEIIQENLAGHVEVNQRPEIRERNFGVLQGLDDSRYNRLKRQQGASDALFWKPEQGESWREVETRVLQFWNEVIRNTPGEERLIVVAHMGPMYSILADVTDRRLETAMEKTELEEGSVFEIKCSDNASELVSDWYPDGS